MHSWWHSGASLGRVDVIDRLALTETGKHLYFRDDGSLKHMGDHFRNPDLANTLARIAQQGWRDFYQGEIAQQIAADMAANSGLLSLEDLAEYQTTRTDPLFGSARGFDVATNHPPGGGIMLLEMLNILECFDLSEIGHNTTEYIRIVCEAMRAATADKEAFVGDPAFVDVPLDRLTGKNMRAALLSASSRGSACRLSDTLLSLVTRRM